MCEGCGFDERSHPIKHILEDAFGNKQIISSCDKFRKKSKDAPNHSSQTNASDTKFHNENSRVLQSADTSKSTDEKCKEEFNKDYDKKT